MSDKNFLNLHVLISHSPSCLNRDDMNMQKSAIFGGKRRVRISSQSLKRAMRKSDYYVEHLGAPSDRTKQLKHMYDSYKQSLLEKYPEELVLKSISFISDKRELETEAEGDAVAPWFKEEVDWLCNQLQSDQELLDICDQFIAVKGNSDADKKKKRSLVNSAKAVLKKTGHYSELSSNLENAVDIALSGRMATSGLMTTVDGAMALAHTITTHAVDADIDWFTAVDDFQELGSGHLDTQEFSSGVFYRYASLNIRQLQENLGGATRERALEIGAHLVHMLSTVVPSAKQQSSAAHNLADLTMASFSDMPISLANAFEKPIQAKGGSGFLKPSIDGLLNYWQKIHNGYGLDERASVFLLQDSSGAPGLSLSPTLPALEAWVRNDGKE